MIAAIAKVLDAAVGDLVPSESAKANRLDRLKLELHVLISLSDSEETLQAIKATIQKA